MKQNWGVVSSGGSGGPGGSGGSGGSGGTLRGNANSGRGTYGAPSGLMSLKKSLYEL